MPKVEVNGLSFDVKAEGPSSGQPVVFLHGYPDSNKLWDAQVKACADAGYRAVAPTLRGFGDSDKPDELEGYSLPSLAQDVLAILGSMGIDKFHLVGHDWGAALAWFLATIAPDRVTKLVPISVGHFFGTWALGGLQQRKSSWYMFIFKEECAEELLAANDWALFQEMMAPNTGSEAMAEYLAAYSKPGLMSKSLLIYRANFSLPAMCATEADDAPLIIQCPTMAVYPADDFYLTESQLKGSSRYVAQGRWRYERLKGVGHWAPRDAPQQLNALLLDFLGGVSSSL